MPSRLLIPDPEGRHSHDSRQKRERKVFKHRNPAQGPQDAEPQDAVMQSGMPIGMKRKSETELDRRDDESDEDKEITEILGEAEADAVAEVSAFKPVTPDPDNRATSSPGSTYRASQMLKQSSRWYPQKAKRRSRSKRWLGSKRRSISKRWLRYKTRSISKRRSRSKRWLRSKRRSRSKRRPRS